MSAELEQLEKSRQDAREALDNLKERAQRVNNAERALDAVHALARKIGTDATIRALQDLEDYIAFLLDTLYQRGGEQ